MVVAFLPWPQGKEEPGLRPVLVCGEAGHEQVAGYLLPFDDISGDFGKDEMQEAMKLTKWWIASLPRFRKGKA